MPDNDGNRDQTQSKKSWLMIIDVNKNKKKRKSKRERERLSGGNSCERTLPLCLQKSTLWHAPAPQCPRGGGATSC